MRCARVVSPAAFRSSPEPLADRVSDRRAAGADESPTLGWGAVHPPPAVDATARLQTSVCPDRVECVTFGEWLHQADVTARGSAQRALRSPRLGEHCHLAPR